MTSSGTNLQYNYDGVPHVFTISNDEYLSIYSEDDDTTILDFETDDADHKELILNNDGNAYLEIRR
jgi:hypothetical protein